MKTKIRLLLLEQSGQVYKSFSCSAEHEIINAYTIQPVLSKHLRDNQKLLA